MNSTKIQQKSKQKSIFKGLFVPKIGFYERFICESHQTVPLYQEELGVCFLIHTQKHHHPNKRFPSIKRG